MLVRFATQKFHSSLLKIAVRTMSMMRGAVVRTFGGPENILVEDALAVPEITDKQVLVRIHCSGINPADTYALKGTWEVVPKLPYTPGMDGAGVVERVGSSVASFKKGDRVYCCALTSNGTAAEYAACKETDIFHLPEQLSYSQGAALGVPYFTAYRGLIQKAKARAGEKVLIHGGSGAVGVAAVQLALHLGLTVVATAGSDEGLKMLTEIGAHHVFNHKEKGYLNNAVASIGGSGFDVVFENVAHFNLGHDCTVINQNARIVVVGCRGPVEITPRHLMVTESLILGIILLRACPTEWKEMGQAITEGIKLGWVRPVIDKEYPLEEIQKAYYDIINKPLSKGRLVVKLQ